MKKWILLAAVVIFSAIAPAFAQETPDGAIHGNVGITYDTLYVWRGILVYGGHSAIHPFINLDLMGTGFGIDVMGHRANSSGYENAQRWDYTLNYMGAFEMEQTWETRYMVGYRYFNYPELDSHTRNSVDLQELFAGFAFPKLLGVQGLVPGYVVIKGWPSNSGTVVGANNPNGGTYAGWAHVFMLDYAMKLEGMSAETPLQTINFHVETVFNDGVDPRPAGGYTDSDWTHVMMGVSTDFDLGEGVSFTPALYHQVTMEDDKEKGVSPDHDITWASATLKYTF